MISLVSTSKTRCRVVILAVLGAAIAVPTCRPARAGDDDKPFRLEVTEVSAELHKAVVLYDQPDNHDPHVVEVVRRKAGQRYLFVFCRLRFEADVAGKPRCVISESQGVQLRDGDGKTYSPIGRAMYPGYGQIGTSLRHVSLRGGGKTASRAWVFRVPLDQDRFSLSVSGKVDDGKAAVTAGCPVSVPADYTVPAMPSCKVVSVDVRKEGYSDAALAEGKVFWEITVELAGSEGVPSLVVNTPAVTLSGPDGDVVHPTGEIRLVRGRRRFVRHVSRVVRMARPTRAVYVFAMDKRAKQAALRFATRKLAPVALRGKPDVRPGERRATENPRVLTGHGDWVTSVAWTSDGKRVVSASQDGTAVIWDRVSGKALHTFEGHSRIRRAALSADDRRIATTGGNEISIWDAATGKRLRRIGHKGVYTVAFSPDGKLLASGAAQQGDKAVYLWDVATGEQVAKLVGHTRWTAAVAFSPDGKLLASAGNDKTLRLWSVSNHKQVRVIEASIYGLSDVAFTPDGKYVVSCGTEWKARLWRVADGKKVRQFVCRGIADALAVSPDGRTLAVSRSPLDQTTIHLYDLKTGERLGGIDAGNGTVASMAFSPSGKTLAAASYARKVLLFDMTALPKEAAQGRDTKTLSSPAPTRTAPGRPED